MVNNAKKRLKSPLSPQWWQSFLSKRPDWLRSGQWHPRVLDLGEMEHLKIVMLADLKVVVIGGDHKYYSPDDVATFFRPSSGTKYNKHIGTWHVADFFMGGSQGAAEVFHFPAIEAAEMSREADQFANRTGKSTGASDEELDKRVAKLFQDSSVRHADAIGRFH